MDDTGWPRPGPGMVAVFALVGLIAGILAGLFNPAGVQRSDGQALSNERTERPSTTANALPSEFWTVILDTIEPSQGRSAADVSATEFRRQGVEDVRVLHSSRYSIRARYWAVSTGIFSTAGEANARRDELRATFPKCYSRHINSNP